MLLHVWVPRTGLSLSTLHLKRPQDKHAQAIPLLKMALSIRMKKLGGNHPDTVSVRNSLEVVRKRFVYIWGHLGGMPRTNRIARRPGTQHSLFRVAGVKPRRDPSSCLGDTGHSKRDEEDGGNPSWGNKNSPLCRRKQIPCIRFMWYMCINLPLQTTVVANLLGSPGKKDKEDKEERSLSLSNTNLEFKPPLDPIPSSPLLDDLLQRSCRRCTRVEIVSACFLLARTVVRGARLYGSRAGTEAPPVASVLIPHEAGAGIEQIPAMLGAVSCVLSIRRRIVARVTFVGAYSCGVVGA